MDDGYASSFNCARVYNGYQDLIYRPLIDGSRGNLENMEMATSTALQNLILIFFPPLILYNDDSGSHIPSFIGYPHGTCASLLLYRSLVDRPLLVGYHGNLVNRGDGDSDISSKLDLFIVFTPLLLPMTTQPLASLRVFVLLRALVRQSCLPLSKPM